MFGAFTPRRHGIVRYNRRLVGRVTRVDGNLCWYVTPDGESDLFIWRFRDGLNQCFDWPEKHSPTTGGDPMQYDEAAIEQQIQAKGLNAPRLTPADIEAAIKSEAYHVFPGTTVTVCCLTLRNGYNVVGHSAAASPENFDAELGRRIAFRNAREQIWPLLGYVLRQQLHETAGSPAPAGAVHASGVSGVTAGTS